MSQLIKNHNKKLSSSLISTAYLTKTTSPNSAEIFSTRSGDFPLLKTPTTKASPAAAITKKSSSTSLASAAEATTSNVEIVLPSSSSAISLFSVVERQSVAVTQISSAASSAIQRKVSRTMPSFKIMSYQNIIALLAVFICGLVTVNGLKCYMCGQYNEGVGSITPCLNYSEQYAHLYLKECSKKSEKYCVKYVSELSIVRDCATECAEKEIWETQTYCCTEDGCNGSSAVESSIILLMLPLVIYVVNEIINTIKQQRR